MPGGVRNVVDEVVQNQNDRLVRLMMEGVNVSKNDYMIIKKEDITGVTSEESESTIEELKAQLNSLTGLNSVKKKVSAMIDSTMIVKAQKEKGLSTQGYGTLHLVFKRKCGNRKDHGGKNYRADIQEAGNPAKRRSLRGMRQK